MKKRLLLMLATGMIIGSLAGCGQSAAQGESIGNRQKEEQ